MLRHGVGALLFGIGSLLSVHCTAGEPKTLPCGPLLVKSHSGGPVVAEKGGCRPTLTEVSAWRCLWGTSPDPVMSVELPWWWVSVLSLRGLQREP